MISTSQMVSLLRDDFAHDVSRPKLLSYIDRAQKELFNTDCAQNLFFNKNDAIFPWPVLSTVAGTLSYDMTTANLITSSQTAFPLSITDKNGVTRNLEVRKIKAVFVMVNSTTISLYNYGERIVISGINPYWMQNTQTMMFYKVPGEIYDRSGMTNARFQFNSDPGTHNNLYYVEFYYAPIDLTSESIPLVIDGDMWLEAISDAVRGYLEAVDNGKSDFLDKFRGYWKKKYMGVMNASMTDRKPLEMPIRKYG